MPDSGARVVAARGPAPAEPPRMLVSLPLRFVVTGLLSLFAGMALLILHPQVLATYHYNPQILAITHLFTLGWITSIIMGATYQLVPVALETRLYSERLAKFQFLLHVVGVVGMVATFWSWNMKLVGHYGSVMGLGMFLFFYNIDRTVRTVRPWNVVAFGIASAVVWLTFTMAAGLYVATAKCWNFSPFDPFAQMHAHAHLGGIGFFTLMLVSVAYKLVPMFLLTEVRSPKRAWGSLVLLNAGLLGLFLTILFQSPWKLAFALVVIGGLALFGWEMLAMLRARKRRVLDWGLRQFFTALSLFVPLSVLAILLCWPDLPRTRLTGQLENVYGFLGLFGVITLAILGMLYKIVPFLVWYHSYSREIGRRKVPTMAELCSAPLQLVTYWFLVAGLLGTSLASALSSTEGVRAGCATLAIGVTLFAVNIAKAMSHLFKPKLEPLAITPAIKANA